jgi:hypothetical protein
MWPPYDTHVRTKSLAVLHRVIGQLKCDGSRAETRFRLSAKRTISFKSARASVQSTTGSRGVRISGSNAGYTMFRGSGKGTGYPLHSPVFPSLSSPCVTVCHHISTGVYTIFLNYLHTSALFSPLCTYFLVQCVVHLMAMKECLSSWQRAVRDTHLALIGAVTEFHVSMFATLFTL